MNERIRELELEAIAYADSKVPANDRDRYNDIYYSIIRGKFAELIVRECVDIAVHNQSGWEAGMRIKEHFGVEE